MERVGNSNLYYLANCEESGDSDNDEEARTKQKTEANSMAANRSNSGRNSDFLNFPQFQLDLKLAVQKAK